MTAWLGAVSSTVLGLPRPFFRAWVLRTVHSREVISGGGVARKFKPVEGELAK